MTFHSKNPSDGSHARGGGMPEVLAQILKEFPLYVPVERLVIERGFGFVAGRGKAKEWFFHVTGDLGPRKGLEQVSPGDVFLCQVGRDPRRAGAEQVLRWIRASDLPWPDGTAPVDQAEYDSLRLGVLEQMSGLDWSELLQAPWYAALWKQEPQADLSDPLLRRLWVGTLATLDPEALRERLRPGRISGYRYDFAVQLDLGREECRIQTLLGAFSVGQLAALGTPRLPMRDKAGARHRVKLAQWYAATAPELAVDAEAWFADIELAELCEALLASGAPASAGISAWVVARALDAAPSGSLAPDQLAALADWPGGAVLFPHLNAAHKARLIRTWRAEGFTQVLERHPDLALSLAGASSLAIDLETDGEEIWEIGCASEQSARRLHDAHRGTDLHAALSELADEISAAEVIVGHNLLLWDWPILSELVVHHRVPLVWDTLLVGYLLDPGAVTHALQGAHHAEEDAAATLELARTQMARFPRALIVDMVAGRFPNSIALLEALGRALEGSGGLARVLPAWMEPASGAQLLLSEKQLCGLDWVAGAAIRPAGPLERLETRLWQVDVARIDAGAGPQEAVLAAVLRRAAAEGIAVRPSMLPAWLCEGVNLPLNLPDPGTARLFGPLPIAAETWAGLTPLTHRLGLAGGGIVVTGRVMPDPLPLDLDRSAAAIRLEGGAWIYPDRAAARLDAAGGWRGLSTRAFEPTMVLAPPLEVPLCVPELLTRTRPALFPSAQDQANYWRGQLASFRAVAAESAAVPILLVVSTESPRLIRALQVSLAASGQGEVPADHHSRLEQLRRAKEQGKSLVAPIAAYGDFARLAEAAGIALRPVVECLPAEEWLALSGVEAPGSISAAALLESFVACAPTCLGPWLAETGLAASPLAPVILDPRAGLLAQSLRAKVRLRPHPETGPEPLQDGLEDFEIQREPAPEDFASLERFLIDHWRPAAGGNAVTGFKPAQAAAIEQIRTGDKDVIVALPTGEGKSVLFQVPALCKGLRNRRLTLVISPLKALMRDQVDRLHLQGFAESVDFLNSDRPPFEKAEIAQGILDHRLVLLYVAPERLRSPEFLDLLARRIEMDEGLEQVVFDETHCLNQWGYEFRPDYFFALDQLQLMLRRGQVRPTPFLMLSATITASDRQFLTGRLAGAEAGRLPLACIPEGHTIANPLRSHIAVSTTRHLRNIYDDRDYDAALAERLPHILEVIAKAKANQAVTGQRSAVLIFVAWRKHAESLAQILTGRGLSEVDYYHAGLDSGTREDLLTRFRDGEIEVLVATKAFGMGMDIPDIHWVIHLSPPPYLEDYLQEVGRIGRGEVERRRAKLDRLDANLMFSDAEFETLRGFRATSAVQEPDVRSIEAEIKEAGVVIEGERLSIFPEFGTQPLATASKRRAAATRVRMALFWLEKAGNLVQMGTVPDILPTELRPEALERAAATEGLTGRIAAALLAEFWSDPPVQPRQDLFSRLLGGLGLTLSAPTPSRSIRHVILNLTQLRRKTEAATLDGVMEGLIDLQTLGAVKLTWGMEFSARPLFPEPPALHEALFAMIEAAVARLLDRRRLGEVVEFNPFDWLDEADWPLSPLPEEAAPSDVTAREKLIGRLRRAYLNGFRTLARASGMRLRQVLRKDGAEICWQARFAGQGDAAILARRTRVMKGLRSFLEIFAQASKAEATQVNVHELIRALKEATAGKGFNRALLEDVMRLAASCNLVSADPNLLPVSHVLALQDKGPGLDHRPDLIAEMRAVNDLTEARTFAMEIFANLPPEAREEFITGYFAQVGAEALRAFLLTQLGLIPDDEDNSSWLAQKREQLRAAKATEFFERYRRSEEPAQWEVMSRPYDRHLLVNAGPGAGKTSVLVGRIVHLIREQHVKPSEIIVLAFNRAVVFEIRRRVRELFRNLGYAAYAGQVRIATFHSFALRHMGLETDRKKALSEFAKRLSRDPSFRAQVAGSCRCLLVDEFQDADNEVYDIITALYRGSGETAGVLVIGDDDQDILRWNREGVAGGKPFSELYFWRFEADFAGDRLERLTLRVNFRSGRQIVARSQQMITGFFEGMTASTRLKEGALVPRADAPEGECQVVDVCGQSRAEVLDQVVAQCLRLQDEGGSLAVLCRWNAEVAEVQRRLSSVLPGVVVQASQKLPVADLRHIALWLDILRAEDGDRLMSADLKEALLARWASRAGAEAQGQAIEPGMLWDLCCEERSHPALSDLVRFIEALATDEVQRLLGARRVSSTVVSTIHKVKGLEYDNVVIVPSSSSFESSTIEMDAAEEARLFYVAMTRAKSRLVYFRCDREWAWGQKLALKNEATQARVKFLEGDLSEIYFSWVATPGPWNRDPSALLAYISETVQVGDPIRPGQRGGWGTKELFHEGPRGRVQVGYLAKDSGEGGQAADLRVSAVVRRRLSEAERLASPELQEPWHLIVLVEGRLR